LSSKYEVECPEPSEQPYKTPLYLLVWSEYTDPETGEVRRVARKKFHYEGEGESARIKSWGDLIEEVKKRASTEEAVQVFIRHAIKNARWGLGCPAGCGRFWWFKPTGDQKGWEPVDVPARKGEVMPLWSEREGYFVNPWTGEPVEDPFEPVSRRGYLDWEPVASGTAIFRCDRCGSRILLKPSTR